LRRTIVIAGLAGVVGVVPARADGPTSPWVSFPRSRPHGKTLGEWSAAWWRWASSMPVTANPLFDTADISAGQAGEVWFLGGTFHSNPDPSNPSVTISKATREGAIPAGTSLFFPVINSEASELEGNGTTKQELSAAARYLMDHAVFMEASIDGVDVKNLRSYREQSPLFVVGPLPEDNLFEAFGVEAPAGTTSPVVADGAYVFVKPMPPGVHEIHFGGAIVFTEEADGFDFILVIDIDYTITVKPF
jgi:hypothetical protein